jgi:OOP family OmpA-OmpF porin
MRRYAIIFLLIVFCVSPFAQNRSFVAQNKKTPFKKRPWAIGLGWNVVDDDGSPFKYLFSARRSWNIPAYPTQLTYQRFYSNNIIGEAVFNFNKYNPGKIINGFSNLAGLFLSLDINLKYDFGNIKGWRFAPFFVLGGGGTARTVRSKLIDANINAGLGFSFWMGKRRRFGLNFQSLAKFAVKRNFFRTNANYLQHSAALLFKFEPDPKKKSGTFVKPRYKWVHRKNRAERV